VPPSPNMPASVGPYGPTIGVLVVPAEISSLREPAKRTTKRQIRPVLRHRLAGVVVLGAADGAATADPCRPSMTTMTIRIRFWEDVTQRSRVKWCPVNCGHSLVRCCTVETGRISTAWVRRCPVKQRDGAEARNESRTSCQSTFSLMVTFSPFLYGQWT
jgi:hypothetical protein